MKFKKLDWNSLKTGYKRVQKYLKRYWNSLNTGYKRIHYLLGILVCPYFIILHVNESRGNWGDVFITWGLITFIIFPTIITIIMWIKEGFEK